LTALIAGSVAFKASPVIARFSVRSPPVDIVIEARPIAAFDRRQPLSQKFGQLRFRGGLVLTSSFQQFGGISAIRVRRMACNSLRSAITAGG
jgi:hypothetical protein